MSRLLGYCFTRTSELPQSCRRNQLMSRFYTFPKYIEDSTFGISCDAFANMKASYH